MEPLSIRYRAQEGDVPVGDGRWQDAVAAAIWTRLQALSAQWHCSFAQPAIVFDEDVKNVLAAAPCIVLLFEVPAAFVAARDGLKTIAVDHETDDPITYQQDVWTTTLDPHILPVDILRFPVDEAAEAGFFAALQDLASSLGPVLGAGLIYVHAGQPSEAPTSSHIIRFYVQLAPSTLRLTFESMVNHLPTLFFWHGATYTLMYPGKEGGSAARVSAPYPFKSSSSNSASAVAMLPTSEPEPAPAAAL